MESRKNQVLLGVIAVLCAVYFIAVQKEWLIAGNVPLFILGGAMLLLYYTKEKSWALWCGVLLLSVWGMKFSSQLLRAGGIATAIFILFIPGIVLLWRYQKTGWESFVTPGCFLFWTGCYGILMEMPVYANKPCTMLVVCLFFVVYTSHMIKRHTVSVKNAMLRSILLFLIIGLLLGIFHNPFQQMLSML